MDQKKSEQLDNNQQTRYRVLNDAVIRYILCGSDSEEKLKAFLNAVFADKGEGLTIEKLSILSPFDPKTFPTDKQPSMDFLAEDSSQRKFHLEFQVWEHRFFIERCLYYWSRVNSRQLEEGNRYGKLNPVISVIVTDFPIPHDFAEQVFFRIHESYGIRSDEPPHHLLTKHFRMHFVQIPKEINLETISEVRPPLANWLAFLGYPDKTKEELMESIAQKDTSVQSALNAYQKFHMDPQLRYIAESCELFRYDAQAYADTREEIGKEIGKEIGRRDQAIEDLLQLIEWNIAPPTEALRSRIEQVTDVNQIKSLYEKVAKRQIDTIEGIMADLSKVVTNG